MSIEQVYELFSQEVSQRETEINLARASLYFSLFSYPSLEINKYLSILDVMAQDIQSRLPSSPYPLKVIQTINHYFFEELGFRGNTQDYYDPRNSFLNQVMERGLGIPISLSVIYLEVARRINFPMVGIGMPGHFLIKPDFEDAGIFVDVFHQGEILFPQDCLERLQQIYQQPVNLEPHLLEPVSKQQIIFRMLTNLKYIYLDKRDLDQALIIINFILLVLPNHPLELRDRGLIYYQLGSWQKAQQDLRLYLALLPGAQDAEAIRELLQNINN